ncbi:MAG TPA: TetR/AcrR family transcriptional regulator [Caulobacteraceae bacterium]
MPRVAGQIDPAKTEAILDAASEVFAERGLAAPMEAIARKAGVSKQTVYNRYRCKAEIIRALVERRVETITAPLRTPGAEAHPQEALAAYARQLLETITRANSLLKVTIQGAGEMPDLARVVFETGPLRSRREVANFLEAETRAGRLDVDDPMQAAEFFAGMVIGHRQTRSLLGLNKPLTPSEMDAVARSAAKRFLRAYAP